MRSYDIRSNEKNSVNFQKRKKEKDKNKLNSILFTLFIHGVHHSDSILIDKTNQIKKLL